MKNRTASGKSSPSLWAIGLVFLSAGFTATFAVLLSKALGTF
jgi:hypothetical protein